MIDVIQPLTQFGLAGLMGALWVWERKMSRHRDAQLDEAHRRLMRQREELDLLVRLVRRNTTAIERFEQTQARLHHLLERLTDAVSQPRTSHDAAPQDQAA